MPIELAEQPAAGAQLRRESRTVGVSKGAGAREGRGSVR